MNILLVSNGFPPAAYGGVEVYTSDLAKRLLQKGHQVCVFCRESSFSTEDYTIRDEDLKGVRVIRVVNDYKKIASFRETFVDERIDAIFDRTLDEISPELVHFNHLIALSARLPLLSARRGIPGLVTLHDYWPICHRVNLIDSRGQICPGPLQGGVCPTCMLGLQPDNLTSRIIRLGKKVTPPGFRRWARQALVRGEQAPVLEAPSYEEVFEERYHLFREAILSAGRLFVPSEFMRTQFARNGYPPERIEVMPLGIQVDIPERQAQLSNVRELRLAYVGSLIPIKGADILIKAFEALSGADLRLSIFGREDIFPRNYVAGLKKLAKKDSRIRFMGPFPPEQRAQVLAGIDVLVIPSRAPESFSLVAREALLLGKPVVAAAVGALPEVVIDGVNGFLFQPGDLQGLKNVLEKISTQPEALSALQTPGPVPILSVEEHVKKMERIYENMLAHGSQGTEK